MPHNTDILILGGGLAGLRAAWAAAQSAPKLRVSLATLRPVPSGSSFANANGQLGMQLPQTDRERDQFFQEILSLAEPGHISRPLAEILVQEAESRFLDLDSLGLRFQREATGKLLRRTACFSPHARAAILHDLPHAYQRLCETVSTLGVDLLTGLETVSLLMDNGVARGAVLRKAGVGTKAHAMQDASMEYRARAVVVALGGPAARHPRHMAGPGSTGQGWELLQAAGAQLNNTDFLQYFWLNVETRQFRSPAEIAGPLAVAMTPDGREVAPSAKVLSLADARSGHCPAAWGPVPHQGELVHDYGMDQWLQAQTNEKGVVRVKVDRNPWEQVALFVHSGNGGAVIGSHGEVHDLNNAPLPGLFACGECTTGMHGANRLGGAMVTATQVFGRRAGNAAARFALGA